MKLKINGETNIFAVLGNPIAHSLSPDMYNAAFEHLHMNCAYVAFSVEEDRLGQAVDGIRSLGIQGGNVTIPFKEKIMPFLDCVTEEARLMGAVNTFYHKNNKMCGANTDGPGFIKALTKAYPDGLSGKRALVLGAGGSARAVAVSLALTGTEEITIINRNINKAFSLARVLEETGAKATCLEWNDARVEDTFKGSGLIINTTPLGMAPRVELAPAVEPSWFLPHQLVVDLIYRPARTLFLSRAKERGCRTMNGMGMLLEQGVLAFELWSGAQAPVEVMARELERRLS